MTPSERLRVDSFQRLIYTHFGGDPDSMDTIYMGTSLAYDARDKAPPTKVTRHPSKETVLNQRGIESSVVIWTFKDADDNEVWSGPVLEDEDFHQRCFRDKDGQLMLSIRHHQLRGL